jgi:chromosome segregation ATPase
MSTFSHPVKALLFLISGVVLLFLFAGIGLPGCNYSKEPNIYAKQLEEMQASLQRIEKELTGLRQSIPKETEQWLKYLENVLNDPTQWPHNPDQSEKLRQDLDRIVQTLPPLTAERILPQLVRLNWGVEALWNLRTHAYAEANQLEEVQATIKELLGRHPQGHFKELHKELGARLSQLQPQLRQFQLKQLLERANRALEDKEDVSTVYSSLDEYRGDKEVEGSFSFRIGVA